RRYSLGMFYRVAIQNLPDVRKVGHIRYRSGWSDSYRHEWNVMIFVLSGEFTYTFQDNQCVKLTSGMHLLIPAGTPYTATVGEDCDYYYVHFRCFLPLTTVSEQEVVQSLKEDMDLQKRARNQDYDIPPRDALYIADTAWHGERIQSLQYRISRCAEFRQGTSPLDRMRLLNAFFKVLISLASTTGEQLLDTKHLSPTLIKITRYIEENYTSQITLQSLATRFGLSKQYIMRLFREQFGMTVTRYINDVKLRKSLELLTFHSLSISEVAYAVGFSSLYYFDRIFKKTYALTPSEYQRRHRLIANSELNPNIKEE
ncbi:MAG: helix-turn-helix domain-containing protein, partial [Clostridia bacterium]|nr:helix-turn-helix domain-containing protein [Clostridia bacterium]